MHRVQLDFSEEAFEELERLRAEMRMSTRAEVIRAGLGILRWVKGHLDDGDAIISETKDGERIEVEFPFLVSPTE